jgi:hypothetical protein
VGEKLAVGHMQLPPVCQMQREWLKGLSLMDGT